MIATTPATCTNCGRTNLTGWTACPFCGQHGGYVPMSAMPAAAATALPLVATPELRGSGFFGSMNDTQATLAGIGTALAMYVVLLPMLKQVGLFAAAAFSILSLVLFCTNGFRNAKGRFGFAAMITSGCVVVSAVALLIVLVLMFAI